MYNIYRVLKVKFLGESVDDCGGGYSESIKLYNIYRVWKVKFLGESVDDCGGGYSESIAEMCDELNQVRNKYYTFIL